MAGIKGAMERVMDRRNEGKVVAKGVLEPYAFCGENEDVPECGANYIIIKLKSYAKEYRRSAFPHMGGGIITVYDVGGDVRIAPNVELNDDVVLMIQDNWSASWMLEEEAHSGTNCK